MLETFDLQDVADRQVKHLSLGEKGAWRSPWRCWPSPRCCCSTSRWPGSPNPRSKRCSTCCAGTRDKQTILIVEHKISQVEDFLQRLTVMHEGKIIADGGYEECLRHPAVRRSYWQIDVDAEESMRP